MKDNKIKDPAGPLQPAQNKMNDNAALKWLYRKLSDYKPNA